jgi:hypothetical protein
MRTNRSILDSVTQEVARFQRGLGSGDRTKLTEYLEAVRDVERRIQKAEEQNGQELPFVQRPVGGIPSKVGEHAKLMFDLQALAFQCDLTRVFTFMIDSEGSDRSYPEIGIPESHHALTHNVVDPEPVMKVTKINTYHMAAFAYFLEKLRSTPDGDGSLLDHSLLIYGGGISDGNLHSHEDLPVVMVGGAAGQIKGGRHIRYANVPLANLLLTTLVKLRVPMERFGDSTGQLDGV